MTEVPEYLLQRSRERRAALGLQPGGSGPPESSAASGTEEQAATTEPAAAATPATVEATPGAAPAPGAGLQPAPGPVPEVAASSQWEAAASRTRVPRWVMPVLVLLPVWGVLYMGSFGERSVKKALTPREVYAKAGCSSCHGSQGAGGTGPALAGGAARLTFPNEEDHINWVKTGSGPSAGKRYGNPNRPGGQRPPATGGMPAFEGQLSEAEIQAVVKFEREEL